MHQRTSSSLEPPFGRNAEHNTALAIRELEAQTAMLQQISIPTGTIERTRFMSTASYAIEGTLRADLRTADSRTDHGSGGSVHGGLSYEL